MEADRDGGPILAEADLRASVAAGFVTGLLAGLRRRGIAPAPLLAAAGLEADALRDPGHRTPIGAYAALYNAVVARLSDEGFGLFSAPLRPGSFEFLCRGVIDAPTLGEALQRAARFLQLVLPDLEVTLAREGELAILRIGERRRLHARASDPGRVFAFEWLLRLLHGLACWLAARALTLDEVRFPFPRPPHASEYPRVYTERSAFGAHALQAHLDARLLELPVRRAAADLPAFLDGAPGKIAMLYRRDREVARSVRELLASRLDQPMSFPEAARRLNVSTRTLHRQLAAEGTSFRALREALRRDRALHEVERTQRAVAEIAASLGYSEPSAFFRAFRGWTGRSPTDHRRLHKRNT